MIGFIIARIISVALLFWAIDNHPYAYYTLLRFVVCGVTAYGAWFAGENKRKVWAVCLSVIAILFNPIIPVHLNREIWGIIDIGVAIILIASLLLLRKQKSQDAERE